MPTRTDRPKADARLDQYLGEVLSQEGPPASPTLMERAGAAASAAVPTGPYGVPTYITEKLPKLITEGVPNAAKAVKRAADVPLARNPLRKALAPSEPVLGGPPVDPSLLDRVATLTDPGAWAIALGEGVMHLSSLLGAAAEELGPEKAKPLTHAFAANAPFLPWKALRTQKLPEIPAVPPEIVPPAAKPMLALPPAPPDPIVPPHARTRSMLPPAPEMKALPPSSAPGGALLPATEPIGATGEAGMRVLGEPGQRPRPTALPEIPRRDVRPSSTGSTQIVIKADDLPPTTTVLDAQGRPITEPVPAPTELTREQLRQLGRTPLSATKPTPRPGEQLPTVPEGPLPSAVEAAEARRRPPPPDTPGSAAITSQGTPGPLPPVPDQPPPGGVFEKPTGNATARTGRQAQIDAADVDLSNPQSVGAYVWGRGGIAGKEVDTIPLHLRRNKGAGLDEIIDELSTALGRPYKEVEAKVHRVLALYRGQEFGKNRPLTVEGYVDDLARAEDARLAKAADDALPEPIESRPIPEAERAPSDLGIAQTEWSAMTVEERANAADVFRFFDERKGKGGLSGILPPIPLPGAAEGDDESTAMVKTAAQALGLSLPLVSMLFSRWRSGPRRPKQQGLGFESPSTPQKSLFDQPLPEVPPPPSTGAGGQKGLPVPPVAAALRFEKTPLGDQAIIPGTPPREMPKTAMAPDLPQKNITETPLFGQERAAREAASDTAQTALPEVPQAPGAVRWQQTRPQRGALDAYRSNDGRFVVEQRTADEWVAMDRQTRERTTRPTFHDARQWVSRMTGGERGSMSPSASRGELPGVPSSRPPRVPEQYRTERVGPEPPPSGPSAPPRTEPPTPPVEAATTSGAAGESPVGAASRAMEYLILPKISVWEKMGEHGKALSRTVQNEKSTEMRWLGQHAEPLIRAMKRLTAAEKANFVEAKEGRALPMNDRVRTVIDAAERVTGEGGPVHREARDLGVVIMGPGEKVHPWEPIADFYPHEFSPEVKREILRHGHGRRERAITHLLDTGQAADRQTAEVILDSRFGSKRTTLGDRVYILDPDRFVGGLERTRDINLPDYIKDPVAAYAIRLSKVARRFAELRHYGQLDQNIGSPGGYLDPMTGNTVPAHGLIGEIQRTHGVERARQAHALFAESLGHRIDTSQVMQEAANKVTTVEALTKLPLAAISNSSQFSQVGLRTGLATMARGLAASVTRAGRQAAQDLGVISDMALREVYRDVGLGERTTGWLQRATDAVMMPFNAVEKWDRIVGANAGKAHGNVIEGRLGNPRWSDWMHRELDRLNFSREEMADIVQRRTLTAEERDRIAWAITDQTQYLGRNYRRSQFFDTPAGQVIGQFKSFAINTSRLMKQMLIDETRQGNYRPLATFVVLFPVVGEGVQDVKSLIRGTERPDSIPLRIIDNVLGVAGLGLATDFLRQLDYGAKGALSFFGGPAANDAYQVLERSYRMGTAAMQGDIDKAEKALGSLLEYGVQQVPFVGPQAAQQMKGTPEAERKRALGPTGRLHLGLNPEAEDSDADAKEIRQRRSERAKASKARRHPRRSLEQWLEGAGF